MVTEKIIIAGYGGQGVISLGYIIAYAGMLNNFNVTHFPSYGAEMRGGTANCSVIISDDEISSPIFSKATTGIIMSQPAIMKFENKIIKNGLLILNKDICKKNDINNNLKVVAVNANRIAEECGSLKAANIVLAGVFAGIKKLISVDYFIASIREYFKTKNNKIIDINLNAFKRGLEFTESFI